VHKKDPYLFMSFFNLEDGNQSTTKPKHYIVLFDEFAPCDDDRILPLVLAARVGHSLLLLHSITDNQGCGREHDSVCSPC
jgi:hypothetical protein